MALDLFGIDVSDCSDFRILLKVSDRVRPHYIPVIDDRLPGHCGLFRPSQLDLNEITFYYSDLLGSVMKSLTNLVYKARRTVRCKGLILCPFDHSIGVTLEFSTDKIGEYYWRTYEFDSAGRLERSYEEYNFNFKPDYMLKLINRWSADIRKEYRLKTSPEGSKP